MKVYSLVTDRRTSKSVGWKFVINLSDHLGVVCNSFRMHCSRKLRQHLKSVSKATICSQATNSYPQKKHSS